ncbi:hypothetical protein [Klebsiella phage P510]|uniref:Uncharacterized protein n=2 Tax=Przondovirus TaxID=1985720 RepID=A0A7S6R997_9CAUD|nr:hypothetical protein [Escherichia coli]QOV05439.1 hypothetical protein [Klebsiella phage P510]QOV07289.1 hypothetical protein DLINEEME_00155 [Klebsiella phage 066042]WNK74590.1 hypothetical protein [Klebsiella phage PCCM_KpP1172]
MSLLEQFDSLMSHLNGEDNDMAEAFRKELESRLEEADDDGLWRRCLEAGGVDNWSWYSDSLRDGGYFDEEDEDDE